MVSPEQFDIYEEMMKTDENNKEQVEKLDKMIKEYLERKNESNNL